jgi:4-amino-4-deoxy-L-arabinose transferase-like glycosyltransferase
MNSTYLLHRPAGTPSHDDPAPPVRDLDEPRSELVTDVQERGGDPGWARPALIALLVGTAIAYMWDLSASGYANSFYAAAVQAGAKSWKAMFFGSIDSSNFITVDKPPGSLWVMEVSGRIFGFSSQSMLVPQALEGVAAVALLYAAVRRWFGAGAGLVAGALLAITPVAALMFRFNNPDALLVCLLVAGAYCLTRALEHAGTKWVVAAGTMIGFAFLAKMMQAFLVLPAFGLVYLVAAPTGPRRRIAQMLAGAAAIVVSCGWWVAIVALWPASSRPMIDGSPDNNIFNLILGYNGLGRIFGSSGPGGGGGTGFSGATGPLRLFDELMGAQASWLLPAALLALLIGLWHTRRAPRTDRTRAALLLWGGWLILTAAVFSFSTGVIHTYYTVALVPAIAALVAIGGAILWRVRGTAGARITAALAVAITASWSYVLLDRTPAWESWLGVLVLATAALAVIGLLAAPAWQRLGRSGRRIPRAVAVCAILACLAGPAAYAAQTITTPHTGSIPSAGPGSSMGGAGGLGGGAGFGRGGGGGRPGGLAGRPPGAEADGLQLFGSGTTRSGAAGSTGAAGATTTRTGRGAGAGVPSGGGPGGQSTVSGALKKALEADAGKYRWVAAVSGSQSAASLELGTGGEPVMAIGGFSNQGGNLTLAQFKAYVGKGEIHYYIASGTGSGGGPGGGGTGVGAGGALGGGAGPGGGSSSSSAISSWVKAHFKAVTVGGQTLYDLTQAAS